MSKEKSICPLCKRVLRNANAWHYCKQVSIDDLFLHKSDAIILVFDRLLQKVADWQDVEISGTKNCVVFVRNKTFLVAKPMTKYLEIKFYVNELIDGILRIQNENELKPKHFQYFRESYLIS
jgi:hypothetical protein